MPGLSHKVLECASGIRLMVFLYCMAQYDSSHNQLKSRSSLNSSWEEGCSNWNCLRAQYFRPADRNLHAHPNKLSNPIALSFSKNPCYPGGGRSVTCLSPLHHWHIALLKVYFSYFWKTMICFLFFFKNNFFSGCKISKWKEMFSSQKLTSISLLSWGPKAFVKIL